VSSWEISRVILPLFLQQVLQVQILTFLCRSPRGQRKLSGLLGLLLR
jgi:hypothetical protein